MTRHCHFGSMSHDFSADIYKVNLYATVICVISLTPSGQYISFLTIFGPLIWLIEKISLLLQAISLISFVLKFK